MFSTMRGLAQRVAQAYVDQRQALGFPWMQKWTIAGSSGTPKPDEPPSAPGGPEDFLLEVGTEELPTGDLAAAVEQLQHDLPTALEGMRLEHGDIRVTGTPRRIIILVEALASGQKDAVSTIKGPPADRAFDDSGKPTKAAEGFARGHGI